ncbi:MAG: S8/S53 family peptidase, partial [Pseudomonadota bacterium]
MEVEQDRAIVQRHDSRLKELVSSAYREQLLPQAGGRSPLDDTPAVLSVVDTWAGDGLPDTPETSQHGITLTQVAKDLVGASTDVKPFVGLPWICKQDDSCRRPNSGGYFGTLSSLAEGIHAAVVDWRQQAPDAPHVINISAGWDRRYENDGSGDRIARDLVLAVIQHAHCLGALVVASSGNDSLGPDPATGLAGPADFVRTVAPDVDDCTALLEGGEAVDALKVPPSGVDVPLVAAVGGVSADSQPVTGRPASEPVLVAYAANATATLDNERLATLTGTSVGALVASAAFTEAWKLHPELAPYQLVELVTAAAPPVRTADSRRDRRAQVCFDDEDGACPRVKRVSVCEARRAVCDATQPRPDVCPGDIGDNFCDPIPASQPAIDFSQLASEWGNVGLQIDVGALRATVEVDGLCSRAGEGYTLHYDADRGEPPAVPCAHRYFYSSESAVDPQPGGAQSCEDCNVWFNRPGELFGQVDNLFVGQVSGEDLPAPG